MSTKTNIYFRADGNSKIGYGHVFRLLALVEILSEDFRCNFFIKEPDQFVINSAVQSAAIVNNIKDEEDFFTRLSANDIVVLDGYNFDESYQIRIKQKQCKLVCIDDLQKTHFHADAVVNHAPETKYTSEMGEPYTKYYTGLDYAILRKEFYKPFPKEKKERNILISLGGSDPIGATPTILTSVIDSHQFSKCYVLVSTAFQKENLSKIQEIGEQYKELVSIVENLDSIQLVNLLDNCTHSLTSASTILMECFSRGLFCYTGWYMDNQENFYNGFVKNNFAVGLGNFNLLEDSSVINGLKFQDQKRNLEPFRSANNFKHLFCDLS